MAIQQQGLWTTDPYLFVGGWQEWGFRTTVNLRFDNAASTRGQSSLDERLTF